MMIELVVVKAIRACNLRCPYCYYINSDTPSYGTVISDETVEALYEKVSSYIGRRGNFTFVWHGGEPLMLGRSRFRKFLQQQNEYFASGQVKNVLQTNGVLIDRQWLELFKELDVGVGISLDGDREAHNRNRVNLAGRGTYDQVVRAIDLCQRSGLSVGALCVVDGSHDADGYQVLAHFQDLGLGFCDFLVPMTNNALQKTDRTSSYREVTDFSRVASFLQAAFRRWIEHPEPEVQVRLFESLVLNAFGKTHHYLNAGAHDLSENLIVEPDGDICLDTDFWQIDRYKLGERYNLRRNLHDCDFSLTDVESTIKNFVVEERLNELPDSCQRCRMRSICRGSHPASRYDLDGRFDHRSAYCEAMYKLSESVLTQIVSSGAACYLVDPDLKQALHVSSTQ